MNGMNSKAVEAKQRKKEQKEEQQRRKEQEALDKYWEDNDKLAKAKVERKLEAQRKQQEKLQRKQELRQLVEKEESELVSNKSSHKAAAVPKMTRAEILRMKLLQEEARAKEASQQEDNSYCDTSMVNMNHELLRERAELAEKNIDMVKASGLDEVLDALSIVPKTEASEKRLKVAYEAFAERMMVQLKEDYPNLKLSQYKDMIFKAWKKSPENPLLARNM